MLVKKWVHAVQPYALARVFPEYDGLHPLPWREPYARMTSSNKAYQ